MGCGVLTQIEHDTPEPSTSRNADAGYPSSTLRREEGSVGVPYSDAYSPHRP